MRSSAASTRCMLRKALLSQVNSAPPTTARSVSATTASRSVKPSCRAGISGSSRARRGVAEAAAYVSRAMMDLQLSAQANSVCHVTYRRPSSNRPAIGQSQQLLGNRPALTNEQLPPIAAHAIAQGLQLIEQIVQRGLRAQVSCILTRPGNATAAMAPTITSTTSSSSKVNAAWSTFGRVTDIGIQAFPTGLPIRALAVESEGLFGTRPVAVQVRPVPGVQRYAALEVGPVPEGPETFIGRRRVE